MSCLSKPHSLINILNMETFPLEQEHYVMPLDFLSQLSTLNREKFMRLGETQYYQKNQLIFQAGSPGNNVYYLVSGRIKIYQLSGSGREIIQWFCFPGELFGLAEITKGGNRKVYSRACSPVTAIKVPTSTFKNFLMQNSDAALLTIELLSCRLRTLGGMLMNIASDDVMTRIIKLLSRFCIRYGELQGEDAKPLDIPLSHQEIADMISASRQTVSSALGKLKRYGVIRTLHHQVQIYSIEKLTDYINNELKPLHRLY